MRVIRQVMCLITSLFHHDPSHMTPPFYPNRLIPSATLVSHSQGPHFSSWSSHLNSFQPKISVVVCVKGRFIKLYENRPEGKWVAFSAKRSFLQSMEKKSVQRVIWSISGNKNLDGWMDGVPLSNYYVPQTSTSDYLRTLTCKMCTSSNQFILKSTSTL